MKKVAVVLSGCGVFDGSEIHETVLTLLALDRAGATVQCTAPDIEQAQVINHVTGEPSAGESRNVLVESARIARGNIIPLAELNIGEFDALIFPGGFGAAKNLCTFAVDGPEYRVNGQVRAAVNAAIDAKKVLGFICIAPAIVAATLGDRGVQFTVGNDPGTAGALESRGAKHVDCPVDGIVVDETLKVVTTPAYMLAGSITEAESGINMLVDEILKRCES